MEYTAVPELVTAYSRYDQLQAERETFLLRARDASELTIPSLLPRDDSKTPQLYEPFQSVGARGVNHLAGKLMMALFPPGASFFKLDLDSAVLKQLENKTAQDTDTRAQFDLALSQIEKSVITRMEQRGVRTSAFECLRHLIVAGNGLLEILSDGGAVFHPLNRFVVKRDLSDNVVEIVVKQTVARSTLPENVRALLASLESTDDKKDENAPVDLYTRIVRRPRFWKVYQEVKGQMIPETLGSYPLDKCAWLPLRFTKVAGADYGTGLAMDYIGDLKSLESLNQSMVSFAAVAAKVLFLFDEAGTTSRRKVQDAPNGAMIEGNAKDVSLLQLEKFADFQVAKSVADGIEKRLEQAFLLLSGAQRDAERVTAEEIRAVVDELEQSLGGAYALLAQELQAPLVRRLMMQMQRSGDLPALPDKVVNPKIVTGVEALGRSSDLMKLDRFVAGLNETFGPDTAAKYIDVTGYMQRKAAALGIDTKGIVRSPEEVQQITQSDQAGELAGKLGPHLIKAAADAGAVPTAQGDSQ